jgi:uncharacterized protein (TIGR02246 family)
MTAEMLSELEQRTNTLADSDLALVQAMVEELESAWNAGDAARFARFFADNADFVNIHGLHVRGRSVIGAAHDELFRSIYASSCMTYALVSLRLLGDRGAVALLRAHLDLADRRGTQESRPTLVLARRGTRWQIALFQNTLVTSPADGRPPGA